LFGIITTQPNYYIYTNGARLKFDYTESGTPALTYFNPTEMVFGETPVLHIYGTDLDAGSLDKIQLVGASTYDLTSIVRDSSTHIHGTIPGGVAVGNYIVRARIAAVNYDAPGSFSVSSGTPMLTSFNPTGIDFGETPVLYIYGSNFDTGSLDKIQLVGGSTYDLTSIVRDSAIQLHGTVPAGVAVGNYTVRARIGGVNYDAPGSFSVLAGTPILTSFSPVSMSYGATPVLHVYGTDLDAGTLDKIQLVGASTYDLTSIVRDSSTHIHGTVPGGVAIDNYTVRARIGGVNYDAPGSFSVSSVPLLTSFNPTGMNYGATPVLHAYGTNLDIGSLDKIQLVGGSTYDLTSIVCDSSTHIHGTVPAGVAVGNYTVRARIDSVNYDAPGSFTVSATPTLTSFSPVGMICGATPVLYVYGTNLDTGSLDKIQLVGGSTYDLTSIVRDSSTQLHGTVPAGVAIGNYVVRARIGGVNYDAPGSFSVSAVPTITKIYGDDGGVNFVKHRKRWCYAEGLNLGTCSSMQLQRQDAAGTVNLTSVANVSTTKIKGWLEGPIPPGTYKLKAVVAAGTIYSANFRISLGPATW